MTSDLTLYYSEYPEVWNLEESKNFIIEDIEEYLSSKKYIKINDFMYLRLKLDLDIKVDIDQSYASNLSSKPFHYVKIEENGETYYYYIRDMEWISENAVRLKLHMDVLNSVPFNDPKGYIFGGDNIILRQHKDRVHWREHNHNTHALVADINVYPEQIEALLYKDEEKVLYDKEVADIEVANVAHHLEDPENTWYLFFITKNNISIEDRNEIYLGVVPSTIASFNLSNDSTEYVLGPINIINLTDPLLIKVIEVPYPPFNFTTKGSTYYPDFGTIEHIEIDNSGGEWTIESIELTPDPSGLTITIPVLCFHANTESDYTPRRILKTNIELVDEKINNVNPAKDLYISMEYEYLRDTLSKQKLDADDTYCRELETKLLFSDFGYWRIVYDAFSLDIKYESLEVSEESGYSVPDLTITYVVSSNPNTYILNQLVEPLPVKYQNEDYSGQFVINRNNEVALYSNDYINYLRVGYNYDVKSKNLQLASNLTSVVGSVFSPGKLANLPSMASSAFSGITSAVFSELEAENSLEKNLAEKKYSAESIVGSDDIDLLYQYTDYNKYKIIRYKPLERLTRLLVKYFQVAGYATNEYGTPDMYSRTAFNFAQCNTNIESYGYLESGVKDEIKEKWNGGVFLIHNFDGTWDDSLDSINIEKTLLEE